MKLLANIKNSLIIISKSGARIILNVDSARKACFEFSRKFGLEMVN